LNTTPQPNYYFTQGKKHSLCFYFKKWIWLIWLFVMESVTMMMVLKIKLAFIRRAHNPLAFKRPRILSLLQRTFFVRIIVLFK
jgi:hypothetical protein